MNWRAAIPNALTLGNLACGVLAILAQNVEVYAIQCLGEPPYSDCNPMSVSPLEDITDAVWPVWVFVGLAAVFDFLDGFVARLLRVESPLGVQLDSLADLVSFGVAPAVYLFETCFRPSFLSREGALSLPYLIVAAVLPLAAAYRLARFNLNSDQKQAHGHFVGLPTPAAGLIVIALTLTMVQTFKDQGPVSPLFGLLIFVICFLLALAMVSRWPFLSFKGPRLHQLALVGVFATGALVAWLSDFQPWSVLATLALYAVVSRALIRPIATPIA